MSEEITELPEREGMDYDVVIVGAGPAGLAAAIRLKQVAPDLSVVVIEKGSEPGAHILSGAVVDPIGLDRLLPDWRTRDDAPLTPTVLSSSSSTAGWPSRARQAASVSPHRPPPTRTMGWRTVPGATSSGGGSYGFSGKGLPPPSVNS